MGCSPWIPRNSSHRPQYDDTGESRHVESNTVEVLWVSAGFVATDFPSGPRPLPTHAQPACFPRPTKNSEEPLYLLAACLYVVSLLARTVLMSLVYQPALETFSRPLAQLLKFVVMELQALTMLPVASLCLIAAFVLRPTLTSMLNREEK